MPASLPARARKKRASGAQPRAAVGRLSFGDCILPEPKTILPLGFEAKGHGMARIEDALEELGDGELYFRLTPGRAQALLEALNAALSSEELDKRKKGVVTSLYRLLASVTSGKSLLSDPPCWVYVVPDPEHKQLTKIGHALDPDRRFARCTDRPTRLKVKAAWRFSSVEEAMRHEAAAQNAYEPYGGDGGAEWLKVSAEQVIIDLAAKWGRPPDRSYQ